MTKIADKCPICGDQLYSSTDSVSGFKESACKTCCYYESNSPAYNTYPELFRNIGECYFSLMQRRVNEISRWGFTKDEAEAWLKQEPTFDRPIIRRKVTAQDTRRRVPRTMLAQYLLE